MTSTPLCAKISPFFTAESWPYLKQYFSTSDILSTTDINTIQDVHNRWFDARISPLTSRGQGLTGWLIVLHDITHSKQAEAKLSKQAADLQTVTEVSATIAAKLDMQELLQQVVDLVSKRFDLYHAHVYLFNEREETLVLAAGIGDIGRQMLAQKRSITLHQKQSLVARAARMRRGIIANDVQADPGFLPNSLLPDTRSEMAVPIIASDQLLGILDVQANSLNRFTDQDQNILTTLSAQIGVALQNARAFAQITEQQARLSEAMQIAKMGSYELDLTTQTAVVNSEFLHLLDITSPNCAENHIPLENLFKDYLRPNFLQDIETSLQEAFASPDISSVETEYHYKKGSQIRYFLGRARIERDQAGKALKMAGTIQDITEQIDLENSEREQRQLAETLHGIGKALTATLDFDQQIEIMLKQIENVIPYDTANIMLVEGKFAHIIRSRGYEKYGGHILEHLNKISFEIDRTENLAWMYYNRHPYVIPDTREYSGWMDEKTSYPIRSWVGTPIIAQNRVIAFFSLNGIEANFYTARHAQILAMFASEAALGLENARLFEAEQHRVEQLALINEISLDLASDLELEPLLRSLYAHLKKIVSVDMFYIALHDPATCQFYLPAYAQDDIYISHDQSESLTYNIQPLPGLTGHIIQNRKTLYIPDMENDRLKLPAVSLRLGDQPTRSYLGVPLLLHGQVTGILSIQSYQLNAYPPDLIRLIETIATQLSIALENVRLYQQALATVERSEALRRAIQEISTSSLEAQEVYAAIHRATELLMPADAFVISLYDEKKQTICDAYLYDHGELWPEVWEDMDQCFAGYVLRKGHSFLINDFDSFPTSEYVFKVYGTGENTSSGLAVPVFLAEKIVGVLFTQSYHKNAYTEDQRKLLEMIASQAAVALDNARLYSEVQRLAITDSLTGLYNRRHFFKLAQVEFERAIRYQHPMSAIMLDLDHFKNINDTYGHLTGDLVLQTIATFCQEMLRKMDILGRYGGEEFVILMPETTLKDAVQTAERLRLFIMEHPIQTDQHRLPITISAGVSVLDITATKRNQEPAKLLERLIDQADQALYSAKQTGRNRVISYKVPLE